MTEIVHVTGKQLINECKQLLADEPITYEQFVKEGKANTLTDGYHRNLWLCYNRWILEA